MIFFLLEKSLSSQNFNWLEGCGVKSERAAIIGFSWDVISEPSFVYFDPG